jgi:hypothetical protein
MVCKCMVVPVNVGFHNTYTIFPRRKMPTFYNCDPGRLPDFFSNNDSLPQFSLEYYTREIPTDLRSRYEPLLKSCKEALVAVLTVPEIEYSNREKLSDAVRTMSLDIGAPIFFGTLIMAALAGECQIFAPYYATTTEDMRRKWHAMHPMSQRGFIALFTIGFGFNDIPYWVEQLECDRNVCEPLPDLLLGHTQALFRGVRRAMMEEVNIL